MRSIDWIPRADRSVPAARLLRQGKIKIERFAQDAIVAHSYRFWRIACSHNTVSREIPPLYMRNRKLFFRARLHTRRPFSSVH